MGSGETRAALRNIGKDTSMTRGQSVPTSRVIGKSAQDTNFRFF